VYGSRIARYRLGHNQNSEKTQTAWIAGQPHKGNGIQVGVVARPGLF
jgi:hypothetical protein